MLCGVPTTALQTRTVPRTQPAYTRLALRSMSELLASRHGRSAWEPSTAAWALHVLKPPLLRLTRVSSKLSQLSRVSPSRTPAHSWCGNPARDFARRVHSKLSSGPPLPLGPFPTQLSARVDILMGVRVVLKRLGYAAVTTANPYDPVGTAKIRGLGRWPRGSGSVSAGRVVRS